MPKPTNPPKLGERGLLTSDNSVVAVIDSNKLPCIVTFSPAELVRHHLVAWQGIAGDLVQMTTQARIQYDYRSRCHLLMAAEGAGRDEGESSVDGLPGVKIRQLSRRLSWIPGGHHVHGWKKPSGAGSTVFFYIDPHWTLVDPELRFAETDFKPRLFFFDRDLWETVAKLKTQIESSGAGGRQYVEALTIALAHELVRINDGLPAADGVLRGGLAGRQQKRAADYIEEHLVEDIPLATLAGLVQRSLYHFSRAFKRSFGMPPHRYHVSRRVERAKDMLVGRDLSVTEIAFKLGFGQASSLTDAFRKFTGRTPIDYRRATA
jgi:AraC-like DNA-binding protein